MIRASCAGHSPDEKYPDEQVRLIATALLAASGCFRTLDASVALDLLLSALLLPAVAVGHGTVRTTGEMENGVTPRTEDTSDHTL